MALFNPFKKKAEAPLLESKEKEGTFTQKRRHRRYELTESDLCTVKFNGLTGPGIRLRNISHFGCLTEPLEDLAFKDLTLPMKAQLSLAGRSQDVEIISIDKRGRSFGIAFRHGSVEALQAMADLILPLQWGVSATFLGEAPSPKDPSLQRFKFRGEGQFDLVVECTASQDVVFLMATFMVPGGHYICVIMEGNGLTTKKTVNVGDPSARMSKTESLDRSSVHMCAAACLGMKLPMLDKCASLLCKLANQ